jgi:hypothetical protein
VYILKNSRKVGFRKTIKSKTSVILLACIFVFGVLPIFIILLESKPLSGNRLFENYVLKPIPESVEILDSFDGSPDFNPDECLHFKISPNDFQKILASKNWQTVSEAPMGGLQCDYKNAAWDFSFPPPQLGSNVITYTFIPRERDFEVMFINTQMNEVYYFYHDGNLP